jgi:beta-glucanase (GH16 family)
MAQKLLIIAFIFPCIVLSCNKENEDSALPEIQVSALPFAVAEDIPGAAAQIAISLSAVSSSQVSVSYSTADSTAVAGKDYTSVMSGKLTFEPGERTKSISIPLIHNSNLTSDSYFKIVFSSPVNCVLKNNTLVTRIINVDYATLVWSDEFATGPLNTSIWNYELGAGGWGNNELETYTNSVNNVHVDSGYLHITALNPVPLSYTSGRITTKGKKEFTYGRYEIRAMLPEGKGIWPALWMLGANFSSVGWPRCGEIDIMELVGHLPSTVHGTVHWDAPGYTSRTGSFTINGTKFSSGFHLFTLDWTPNYLKWYVDNQQFFFLNRNEIGKFPLDLPQFFIFNVAVGGNWPGSPDQTTMFPQHMIIDYIRVYQ